MLYKRNTPSGHTKLSTWGQRLEVEVGMVAVSTPCKYSEFPSLYNHYALANVSAVRTRVLRTTNEEAYACAQSYWEED